MTRFGLVLWGWYVPYLAYRGEIYQLNTFIVQGQGTATAISYFYFGWTYMAPVLGAIVADSWLGRYKTICLGTM